MPSVSQKLQLKAPYSLLLLNAPDHLKGEFEQEGGKITAVTTINTENQFDVVQLFVTTKAELDTLGPQAVRALKPGGMLWIAYPKKSSGIKSDLTRDHGWATIKGLGYEGVRQIAIDETWSSLRFKHVAERIAPSKMGVDYPGIDRVNRTVTIPEDLQQAMEQVNVQELFAKLSFTDRKEHVIAVLEAKRPETRQARISKIVAKLQAKA
ncbi:YdeI/OmpD-associated family protein [Pontibacter sp. BT310]|uniref:YdeI/OmpD-associated family protein n=1 Tax=Pontibacter populi TaxID=890055 RepID=A0ABS6X9H6_9BACT|nr:MULTISPECIES: YdeI/OmpD-associated family protein [Pontibacter]MBJ6117769.1 YdeI/OmpD-associated family protein [Pontibacter sp. BT310]MBR0570195.1 YdeI/OmpD-associated family protein [Microvirga sp. STS03]MBW3364621.1 YdeI/OmpD-associated family protein [Pontibacter populi]